jgi:hypothetical protein
MGDIGTLEDYKDVTVGEWAGAPAPVGLSKLIGDIIKEDEGYTSSNSINVPAQTAGNSGITIAGVDLAAAKESDVEALFSMLEGEVSKEQIDLLKANSHLKGRAAGSFLTDNNISFNLSEELLGEIPAELSKSYELQIIKGLGGEENYNSLPDSIKAPLVGLTWLNYGKNSVKALRKAIESGADEDWDTAISNYEHYWDNQSQHNKNRSQRVANAIKNYRNSSD